MVCVLCMCFRGWKTMEILQYKGFSGLQIYILYFSSVNLLFQQNCFCVIPNKLFHMEFGETTRDELHSLRAVFFKE